MPHFFCLYCSDSIGSAEQEVGLFTTCDGRFEFDEADEQFWPMNWADYAEEYKRRRKNLVTLWRIL